jgi:BirA family biotin operon repressor/biotin-[acetyl-CoA-carboxylase] ligase
MKSDKNGDAASFLPAPPPCGAFRLAELRKGIKPFRLHWFPRLRSTNDHASAMRKRGELFAPSIVLTGCQTAGRGRGENSWWSQPGVLTVTFVFPIDEQVAPHQLPLLAGLAIRNAAASLLPRASVQLKWPNDLLVGGRKLAGLLCERVHKADLIGLGMNVNLNPDRAPAELQNHVTSLSAMAGRSLDVTSVLIHLAKGLHAMLSHRNERSFAQLLRQYDEHHALMGRRVTISSGASEPPITGKCEGLDSMGRLLVRDRTALHHVIAGQVRLLNR